MKIHNVDQLPHQHCYAPTGIVVKTMEIPSVGEEVEHMLLVEMQNGKTTVENSMAVCYKLNITAPSNSTPRIYPREMNAYTTQTCV